MSKQADTTGKIRTWQWVLVALLGLALGSLCASLTGCGKSDDPTKIGDPGKLLEDYDRSRRKHDPIRFEEVDLGEYFTTKYIEGQGTYTVRFHLYAVVDRAQKQELLDAIAAREKRMRDIVLTTVGKTELEYYREPTLGWLRSELIAAVNRSLHTRVVRDVVFSEFSFERA